MVVTSARIIRTDIEAQIATGQLQAGDRLPSVRDLADQLGVSPATVWAAYRELRLRGMVMGRGRQGTLVAPKHRLETTFAQQLPAGLIDAMSGTPDPTLLPPLGPALQAAVTEELPPYGGPLVDPALAAVAKELFERDGIAATHLTVTSGAMDAVERVLAALDIRIGDRIGVEDPGHIPVHALARRFGLELVPLKVDEIGITPTSLASALELGLAAMVVTPRAHNPTGAALTATRASELSALLKGHPSTALIQDDHAGAISGVDYHPIAAPGARWATMRSLGKSFGPDLRVALVAGDAETIHRLETRLGHGPGWVSFILQRMAASLLSDPTTAELLDRAASSYRTRRDRLIATLAEHDVVACGVSGLNVWIPTAHEQSSIEAARSAGYAIRSADPYRLSAEPAVRVTISGLNFTDIDALGRAIASAHSSAPVAAAM